MKKPGSVSSVFNETELSLRVYSRHEKNAKTITYLDINRVMVETLK